MDQQNQARAYTAYETAMVERMHNLVRLPQTLKKTQQETYEEYRPLPGYSELSFEEWRLRRVLIIALCEQLMIDIRQLVVSMLRAGSPVEAIESEVRFLMEVFVGDLNKPSIQ